MAQDQRPATDGDAPRRRSAEPQSPPQPAPEPPSADWDATLVKPPETPPESNRRADARTEPSSEDVPADWEPGMEFLDYKVEAELGRGSFGTVHKVHHMGWNVDMAAKSALAHVNEEDIAREAEVWMELGLHPNIVSCYFVRTLGGIPRIFVEYVEGGTLHEWLYGKTNPNDDGTEAVVEKPRKLTRAQRLGIAIEICRGMQHAHSFEWTDRNGSKQVGLVHRDLKLLNILMTADGVPRITDFGLVGFGPASTKDRPQQAAPAGKLDAALVNSIRDEGGLVGTPAYAAPEQWSGRASVGKAADVYAFGVILYELFCGRRPFELPAELQHAVPQLKQAEYERLHCEETPPAPTSLDADIDPELSALMLQCLAKDAKDRGVNHDGFTELSQKLKTIYKRLEDEDYDDRHPEPKAAELLADSLNNRALSYLEIGQPKRAEALWEKALTVDPHHPEATYNRGLVLWRSGRMTDDELVRQLEEVRRSHQDAWDDGYLLALLHLERGDCPTAVDLLKELAVDACASEVRTALSMANERLPKSRRLLRTFRGHSAIVRSLWISPDGARALSASDDKTLRVWDTRTGQLLEASNPYTSGVSLLRLSADGSLALLAGSDQDAPIGHNAWTLVERVKLWDLRRNECLRSFAFHARDLALSPDGTYFLAVSHSEKSGRTSQIQLWDITAESYVRSFEGHSGIVNCISISPDGTRALSGSDDRTLKLWDVQSGRCTCTFSGHRAGIIHLSFACGGCRALTVDNHGRFMLWDLDTGDCIRQFGGAHGSAPHALALDEDGRHAISGGYDKKLRLWDVSTGRCIHTYSGHTGDVTCCALGPRGEIALSGSGDKTVRLWSLAYNGDASGSPAAFCRVASDEAARRTQKEYADALQHGREELARGDFASAARSLGRARSRPGCRRRVDGADEWAKLYLHLPRKKLIGAWETATFQGHSRAVLCLCVTGDERHLISGGMDETVRVWDVNTGRCLHTLAGFRGFVESVSTSKDGRYVLASGGDPMGRGDMRLWDIRTGQCLARFEGHPGMVPSASLSQDGRFVLSGGGGNRRIMVWDAASGRALWQIVEHAGEVTCVALSPEGRYGLSGRKDKTIILREIATGNRKHILEGHTDMVWSVCFSADGRRVLSGSHDKTLKLWDVDTGQCAHTFEGHSDAVKIVCLTPDNCYALSGSSDETLRLWDLANGRCVRTFEGELGSVSAACISVGRGFVFAGGHDGAIKRWRLDWELEAKEGADWDEGARGYLQMFLRGQVPYAANLPRDERPSKEQIYYALTRRGKPACCEDDFRRFLYILGCAGYGWLRPEGVWGELEKMRREWQGSSRLPGEPGSHLERDRPRIRNETGGASVVQVRCECGTVIEVPEEQIGADGMMGQCADCGAYFLVRPRSAPPSSKGPATSGPRGVQGGRVQIPVPPTRPQDARLGRGTVQFKCTCGEVMEVPKDQIGPEGLKGRCGKCGSYFVIKPTLGPRGSGRMSDSGPGGTRGPAQASRPGGPTSVTCAPQNDPSAIPKPPHAGRAADDLEKTLIKPPMPSAKPPTPAQSAACPRCGRSGAPFSQFCVDCGVPLVLKQTAPVAEGSKVPTPNRCSCGFENPPANAFCNRCGKPVPLGTPRVCPHCGRSVPDMVKFCVYCLGQLRS